MEYQEDLNNALEVLKKGGIILYPTDTIWGIGCDATNEKAIERIFKLKKRADSKSMISLVDSIATLDRTVATIPEAAEMLIEVADKPLTIIYDNPLGLAPNLLASDGSAGIRITSEKFSGQLCRLLRKPLVSTSANISGEPAPASFQDISEDIVSGVDYVVSYGRQRCGNPAPSGIIKVSNSNEIKIIR